VAIQSAGVRAGGRLYRGGHASTPYIWVLAGAFMVPLLVHGGAISLANSASVRWSSGDAGDDSGTAQGVNRGTSDGRGRTGD
jgi:hypothetical protein